MSSPRSFRCRRGSVLILVVALLAVLFVTGMGFLSMTSIDRLSSHAAERSAALAIETDAVVDRIVSELSRDLWGDDNRMLSGRGANEPWDFPCSSGGSGGSGFGAEDDPWLASNMPETISGGNYVWRHVSNLSGQAGFGRSPAASDTDVQAADLEADADMDGIKDARWVLSPTGRYRYAVRIIDLNGMLNLNTGGRGFPDDIGDTPYHVAIGLSNLEPYWNSYGDGDVQMVCNTYGRGAPLGYDQNNNGHVDWQDKIENNGRVAEYTGTDFAMDLDNPFIRLGGRFPLAHPYRSCDTLALLSYGVKPGPVAARIAVGWPSTFASRRNRMPNILNPPGGSPTGGSDSYNLYYTTYGWTRHLRAQAGPAGAPPAAPGVGSWDDWRAILDAYDSSRIAKVHVNHAEPHDPKYTRALVAAIVLGGAMAGHSGGLSQRQIEQFVVNLVDFRDADQDVSKAASNPGGNSRLVDTVFNSGSPSVYGNEPAPFFVEIGVYNNPAKPGETSYAVELYNPYKSTIDVSGWQIRTGGGTVTLPPNTRCSPGRQLVVRNQETRPGGSGAWANASGVVTDPALNFGDGGADVLLLRPQHGDGSGDMLVVEKVAAANVRRAVSNWCSPDANGLLHAVRPDREWMFSRDLWFQTSVQTWGAVNRVVDPDPGDPSNPSKDRACTPYRNGLQAALVLPTDNRSHDFETLGQLHWIMLVGPEPPSGMPVTERVTAAATPAAVNQLYFNPADRDRGDWRVLCNLVRISRRFNGRDDNGDGAKDELDELRLPGLVNINTAPPHVIRFLSWYLCPSEHSWASPSAWDYWANFQKWKPSASFFDFDRQIYQYRQSRDGFRAGVGEVMQVGKLSGTSQLIDSLDYPDQLTSYTQSGSRNYRARNLRRDLLFYFRSTFDDNFNRFHQLAAYKDLNEQMFLFDRISDLITTRSDSFLAYIVVEAIDRRPGASYWDGSASSVRVVQRRRLVAIFDRSLCNYPPTDVRYVAPQVIARSVATW